MNLILVPFLLASHVPPNNDDTPIYLVATYYVQVNTTFSIDSDTTRNFILSNFTSKFMCVSMARDKLSCYIKSPELIVTSTILSKTSSSEVLEKTLVNIPFDYINSMPVEMIFDSFGIEEYNIADDAHPSTYFLNLFEAFGNLLSIGSDMHREKNSLRIWEESHIGRCLTDYTLDDTFENFDFISSKYRFILKSISDFDFEDNKIKVIGKHRHIETCHFFNDYMFGITHANISFPVHHKMKQSISRMRISTELFTSETQNTYKLYNQDEKDIGFAREHIYLYLDAIEHVKIRTYY